MFQYYENEFYMITLLNKAIDSKIPGKVFKNYLAGNASIEEKQQIENLLKSLKSEYPDMDIQKVIDGWKNVEKNSPMKTMGMKNYF